MDPVSTALSAAWLDALRRARSDMVQRLQQMAPATSSSTAERTLTDIIESGLEHGGAAPLQPDAAAPLDHGLEFDLLA